MGYLFRNQIVLSKASISPPTTNMREIRLADNILFHDQNVPRMETKGILLLGWAWNCATGKKLSLEDLDGIRFANVVERSKDFCGRYWIVIEGAFVFTDATSTYALYYDSTTISTSLSLLLRAGGNKAKAADEYSKALVLPPKTAVDGVRRMIPGEYLDLSAHEPRSIQGFMKNDRRDIGVDERKKEIAGYLKDCASGLLDLVGDRYRLMLTGGKDSRLSLLALNAVAPRKVRAFTHLKPKPLNDRNDSTMPRKLADALGADHVFTRPERGTNAFSGELDEHAFNLSREREPGSTFFYHIKGNWSQIREEYLIDNYYETGRRHLLGKGYISSSSAITLENALASRFISDKGGFDYLLNHLAAINDGCDSLDLFYFIKNFVNVAYQFELIDYSHTPLVFCNSLSFFRALLSVPDEFRTDGVFHNSLLEYMAPAEVQGWACNSNSRKLWFRIWRRVQKYLKILYSSVFIK